METVLITGGSGTIGKALSALLKENNYSVRHLSRSIRGTENYSTFIWDLKKRYIDPKALENLDHIIHLAGENVGTGRWTTARKERILSSRIATLQLLSEKLGTQKLKSFTSASGISYYGSKTTSNIYKETDPSGSDFLAEVSIKWEEAALKFNTHTDRITLLRTGVVLSPTGGALEKLIKPIKMRIGSPLGTGEQYMPWLHLNDICAMYLKAVQDDNFSGIYNAVSSVHTTNKEMTLAIANKVNRKIWFPKVPSFLLKLLFGEMAIIILEGSRIDNQKIKDAGFTFKFDDLDRSLADLIS